MSNLNTLNVDFGSFSILMGNYNIFYDEFAIAFAELSEVSNFSDGSGGYSDYL